MRRGTRLDEPLRSEPSLDPEDYMSAPYAAPSEVAREAIEAYVRATASNPRRTPEEAMRVAKRAANDATDDVDAASEISEVAVQAYRYHLSELPPEPADPDQTNEEADVDNKFERPLYKLARSEAETALQCLSSVIHEIVQRSMPETREPNVDFMLSQLENSRIAISRARRYCENVKPDDPDETNEEIAVELAIAEVDEADRDWLGRGRYER